MIVSGKDCCQKIAQKRLQLVFRATYFVISLSKKAACKSALVLLPILQRTQSYVAIDIHPSNDHHLDHEPFVDVDKNVLADLVKDKNFDDLSRYGGTKELATILETDEKNGISSGEGSIKKRVEEFGSNTYKKAPVRGFLSFLIEAFKDSTIIILLLCAALSLGFGIKQHGPKEGWYDGGSIIVAVVLVLAVSAISNFKQSRQFMQLSSESSNIEVEVVRDGRRQPVSIFDVVVGDIVCLKTGDHIPADGLFLDGHSVKVDESSMTGESDQVEINETQNPFLLSGTKVMDGYGHMLVTSACETMGAATTICTDKTGTLTLNQMQVTEFWLGKESLKEKSLEISPDVTGSLQQGVGLNTTGEVHVSLSSAFPEISGSPTESALLSWAISDMQVNIQKLKHANEILHVEPFNSEKKRSGILVRNNGTRTNHVHWKGAAEMILAMCSNYYVRSGMLIDIDGEEKKQLEMIIQDMAGRSLRCIAFACKRLTEESQPGYEYLPDTGLTLLGFVGLKDPCRPEVKAAVESCRKAGVTIKMITGDNIFTARSIALDCGILKPNEDLNDAIVEGATFRNYSPEERMEKIDGILVMARSTPLDKLLMVQSLKQKGQVVAVTGDGTNDALALKEADIGLSMGIQGTEVAKESSDIVILDDNFNSVVTVLKWGRCVYNNIQKFIQFQLTVNVAALVINFVAAISSGEVPLTAVQLLWVNLIMDTLGALALATEQPTDDLMDKKPVGRTEPLITNIMWRNLIAQALYQVTVLLVLQFRGSSIFGVSKKVKDTLIFNSFVLCQLFNEFNARKLERKNIFEGILKNKLFIGIVGMTLVLQVIMVEFLQRFANTERLNWGQWLASIGIAALSWPIGWLVKCIPVCREQLSSHFYLGYTVVVHSVLYILILGSSAPVLSI